MRNYRTDFYVLDTEEASEADVGKGDDYMEIEIQEQ